MKRGEKLAPSPTLGWKNQRGSIPKERGGGLGLCKGAAEIPVRGRQRHQETSKRPDRDPGRETQRWGREQRDQRRESRKPGRAQRDPGKEHRDPREGTQRPGKEHREPGERTQRPSEREQGDPGGSRRQQRDPGIAWGVEWVESGRQRHGETEIQRL